MTSRVCGEMGGGRISCLIYYYRYTYNGRFKVTAVVCAYYYHRQRRRLVRLPNYLRVHGLQIGMEAEKIHIKK